MTEEEMAYEYAKYDDNGRVSVNDDKFKAFLAGLKAGKPQWHKVADGDYPPCEKDNYTVNVLTNDGDIAYYDFNDGCWIAEPSSVEIDPPIAWCEIPKYTEE